MTDEKMQALQNQIMAEMKHEEEIEKEIENQSREIGSQLVFGKKHTAEIQGRQLIFAYRDVEDRGRKGFVMTITDATKFAILQGKYTPYMVQAEIENNFSLQENLISLVEASLRHIFDRVKVGEI